MLALTLDRIANARPLVFVEILEVATVRCTNRTHTERSCGMECPKNQRRYLWIRQSTMSTKCGCTVAHLRVMGRWKRKKKNEYE